MNFRLIIYWFVCLAVAVVASGYMVGNAEAADEIPSSLAVVSTPTQAAFQITGVPEMGRAVLLFIGILAIAYTYQRAWVNFRSSSAAQKR